MTSVLSSTPKELPMPPAIGDLPSVCVQINGVDVELLIDTGSIPTFITESVAKKCGVIGTGKLLQEQASHGNFITSQEAFIDSFKIGDNEFTNNPCTILADSAVDTGNAEIPPINGAVGWEVIKKFLWTVNFRDRSVRIEMSKSEKKPANMCFDMITMVNLKINGKNMVMGLDTGAGATQFGKCISDFFGKHEKSTFANAMGAGSTQDVSAEVIPHIDACMSGSEFVINNALLYTEKEYSFSGTFLLPGVLGSDIARNKTLIIDYPNRNITVSG